MDAMDLYDPVGPSFEWIVNTAFFRAQEQAQLIKFMGEVRDRYNGDIVYPWSEGILSENEQVPLTPHLIGEGVDQLGMRAAEVSPAIYCPATHPAAEKGQGSREWASIRQRAYAATLQKSRWQLLAARAYRQLAGYATFSLICEPDFKAGLPKIRIRNPLNTYPDPRMAEDYDDLEDCLYIFGHSGKWLKGRYPFLDARYGGPIAGGPAETKLWDVLEWVDGDCYVTGLLGERESWQRMYAQTGHQKGMVELMRIPNRAGRFPGVVPARITLDRIASALQHVVGSIDWAARLQFLNIVATEKAVFPDIYVVGENGQPPRLLNAERQWKDGRTGEINEFQNVAQVGQLRTAPDQSSLVAIDKMENNARRGMGLVEPMAGSTHGALRTGRGIDALMDVATSPRIGEMHKIMEAWLPTQLAAVGAVYRGYWGSKSFSMYSGYPADKGQVNFTPNQHFERDNEDVIISYPIAGAGVQDTNIGLTQLFGAGAISMRDLRERHPWLQGDAKGMESRKIEEQLQDIALQTLTQAAMTGQLPLADLAELEKLIKQGEPDILSAIGKLTAKREREAAAEQEAQAAQMADAQALGAAQGAPAALPAGPPPGTPGPTEGQAGLRELMNTLAAGNRQVG